MLRAIENAYFRPHLHKSEMVLYFSLTYSGINRWNSFRGIRAWEIKRNFFPDFYLNWAIFYTWLSSRFESQLPGARWTVDLPIMGVLFFKFRYIRNISIACHTCYCRICFCQPFLYSSFSGTDFHGALLSVYWYCLF